jgi:hypothetical protein
MSETTCLQIELSSFAKATDAGAAENEVQPERHA